MKTTGIEFELTVSAPKDLQVLRAVYIKGVSQRVYLRGCVGITRYGYRRVSRLFDQLTGELKPRAADGGPVWQYRLERPDAQGWSTLSPRESADLERAYQKLAVSREEVDVAVHSSISGRPEYYNGGRNRNELDWLEA